MEGVLCIKKNTYTIYAYFDCSPKHNLPHSSLFHFHSFIFVLLTSSLLHLVKSMIYSRLSYDIHFSNYTFEYWVPEISFTTLLACPRHYLPPFIAQIMTIYFSSSYTTVTHTVCNVFVFDFNMNTDHDFDILISRSLTNNVNNPEAMFISTRLIQLSSRGQRTPDFLL